MFDIYVLGFDESIFKSMKNDFHVVGAQSYQKHFGKIISLQLHSYNESPTQNWFYRI